MENIHETLKQKLEAERARTEPSSNLKMRLNTWLDRVTSLLLFLGTWWSPRRDEETGLETPGFATLGLEEEILVEAKHLVEALRHRHRNFRNLPKDAREQFLAAARSAVRELVGFLDWLADDDEALALELSSLREAHQNAGHSLQAWATRMEGALALAMPRAERLHGMAGFDRASLDTWTTLVADIRAKPDARRYREGRDRMITMLQKRVRRLQQGGALIFRRHPHLAEELLITEPRTRGPARSEELDEVEEDAVEVTTRAPVAIEPVDQPVEG